MTKVAPASNRSSAAVKRTDAQTINPISECRLELHPCSCCDSDDPCENACEDTDTLKIEYQDSDSVK